MTWIIYPAKTEPVLATPETVSADRWLQPFSEPSRRKVQAATPTLFQPIEVAAPVVVPDIGWLSPLDVPTRRRVSAPQQLPFQPSTTPAAVAVPDQWLMPLSVPVRRDVSNGWMPVFAFAPAAPFPESTSADRWFRPLSEPKRFPKRLHAAMQPAEYRNVTTDIGTNVTVDVNNTSLLMTMNTPHACVFWTSIDDSQTPGWAAITPSQSPGWTAIDDSQTCP
jgi:hypothetical protein